MRHFVGVTICVLVLATISGCQSDNIVCAGVGGPGLLRLEVVDRQSGSNLTARATVTVQDLRDGFRLSGLGNEPLRATDGAPGRWSILVELAGYRSRQDTVLLTRRDPCDRGYVPPVYRMEIDGER
jgi:hypothetical protein